MDHNMEFVNEFKVQKMFRIPDRYVMNRWRKQAFPSRLYSMNTRLAPDQSNVAALRNEVLGCVNVCVDRLRSQLDGFTLFADKIKELKADFVEQFSIERSSKRHATVIENLVCAFDVEDDEWTLPQGIRNKGCGMNRSLVGPDEKPVEKKNKKNKLVCVGLATSTLFIIPAIARRKTWLVPLIHNLYPMSQWFLVRLPVFIYNPDKLC